MMHRQPTAAAVALSCLLTGTVLAHGGQYRGPTYSRAVTPGGRGSTGPGGGPPITPGGNPNAPIPTPTATTPDVTRWQVWWELNKDAYLRAPKIAIDPRSPESPRDAIPEKLKRDVIIPALRQVLNSASNQHINSACMIAMAKIGLDHPTVKILDEFRDRLRRGNQEIREVAALSMGISKQPAAIDDLAALLQDSKAGRRLMGRESVDDRTRTFAAYGLGLLARGSADVDIKTRVFEALKVVLEDREERSRDILVGVLNGMRLIDPMPSKSARHRRLLWTMLQYLEEYQARKMTKTRQATQAHALTAVGRLLGRGMTADHKRLKGEYADMMGGRRRLHPTVFQSAAIAMGQLTVAPESFPEDAGAQAALHRLFDHSRDELTRNFAVIAMGQIGGKANLDELIKVFRTGKRDLQGWAALALGLLAFHAGDATLPVGQAQQRVGDIVGEALHKPLLKINNRDVRAAIALALGLAKYKKAVPDLQRMLKHYARVEEFAGYICMGLALLDDKGSGEMIHQVLADAARRPLLMSQAAMALARLKHPTASSTLREMLRGNSSFRTLTMASASNALGYLADEKNVAPLVAMMKDTANNDLIRAFAAVALGSMAENDPLTWSAWVAMNMNYTATVPTLTNGASGILDIL